MEVEAELGLAFLFASYDEKANQFRVYGHLLEEEHIGQYMITIKARFFSDTYEETYTGTFFLTVWDTEPVIEPWMPPDPIEYQKWDGAIRENAIPEPFDPLKPIPYVHDLTQTGVMTIGWDKLMVPPTNYTVLPQA